MVLQMMESLHKYIMELGQMQNSLAPKNIVIGYRPCGFMGMPKPKFATLHGGKKYRCLILHLEPGVVDSVQGKKVQQLVQKELKFDIGKVRKLKLSPREVYIPFDVIDSKDKLAYVKLIIETAYNEATRR